jgi:hypothetical protein
MIEETLGEISRTLASSWRVMAFLGILCPTAVGSAWNFGAFGNLGSDFTGLNTRTAPDRSNIRNSLADLSAERYEAGGMLRTLKFVGVSMDPLDDRLVNPADREKRDATMTLSVPYDTAVVIIAAEPMNWTVNGARERARVGFEGAAPFAIKAPSGVMSGFRIGALGAPRIAYPIDPIRETDRNIARLCRTLQIWGNHFDVDMARMEYVLVANPTNLTISGTVNPVGGRIVASYGGSTLRSFCYGQQRTSRASMPKRIYNPVTGRYN